ncbi:MAG TPA: glycosyltransferase family 1 protein [Daejeonella sp.]|nr:glycosyltransferase family 1 protein [Daejeonella sp.]
MTNPAANISQLNFQKKNRRLPTNILCFSHIRWDFVYQRPQHLLSRFSKIFNVYYLEEPVFEPITKPHLSISPREENLWLLTPHLPQNLTEAEILEYQEEIIHKFLQNKNLTDFAFWYYTPMALAYTKNYKPGFVIYDCMDELSAFKFAPVRIKQFEQELFKRAQIVFTGGFSLYEAKKGQHSTVFPFPSSIDKAHFEKARTLKKMPNDQLQIPGPRIGFFGVIDERFDIDLLSTMAEKRPEWQFILIGPVLKIDPAILPQKDNIHYLGSRTYMELPAYLSGWDVALIPFMLNESTKFISPTKTPEYLAAGIPAVSTAIRDVVKPYGESGLVHIASSASEFIKAIEMELKSGPREEWLMRVDDFLKQNSWDLTCAKMLLNMETAFEKMLSSQIKVSVS